MIGIRRTLLAAAASTAFVATAFAGAPGEQTAYFSVPYDQSKVLYVDQPVKTVIVGNPAIADAQLINDHTIYVIGRMFGNTNIIAIDANGSEVSNTQVTVNGGEFAQVTLYRGPNGQRNLACSPRCERTITQGDAEMQAIFQDSDKKVEISSKSAQLASPR